MIARHVVNGSGLRAARAKGLSIVELIVAMAIGLVLVFGATEVYVKSRSSYQLNEVEARLQENARYAFAVLEPDIRMSNYWGLIKGSDLVTSQSKSSESANSTLGGLAATECGTNLPLDLLIPISGSDNNYPLACAAHVITGQTAPRHSVTADTLTIRRAASLIYAGSTGDATKLQICSTRNGANIIRGGTCEASPDGQINDLIVNTYYVDRDTEGHANVPALRRKWLTSGGSPVQPTFSDVEIVPGIEDMQVQFGIDPNGGLGANSGVATQYVSPGSVPAGAQIVAIKIWILVRADDAEPGFVDDRVYEYADRLAANGTTFNMQSVSDVNKAFKPMDSTDNSMTSIKRYRRILSSRTIFVHNALGT